MIVIGLGKENIIKDKVYDVSDQVGEVLISKGLAYKEGTKKPTVKKVKGK
tara:strand:+ start:403 stop:552 length:150 start_codon:yes stop_codon:yes gene_type:complete